MNDGFVDAPTGIMGRGRIFAVEQDVQINLFPERDWTGTTYRNYKGVSILHEELTNRALKWFSNRSTMRGCKGATEMNVANGYVADALLLMSFQWRYYLSICRNSNIKKKLISKEVAFNTTGVNVWWEEGHYFSYPVPNDFAIIVETKVSRADFLSTFKDKKGKHSNRHKPVASLHYIVTPRNMVKIEEVPKFWGLLEAYGVGLSLKKEPVVKSLKGHKYFEFANKLLHKREGWNLPRHLDIDYCPDCHKLIESGKEKRRKEKYGEV